MVGGRLAEMFGCKKVFGYSNAGTARLLCRWSAALICWPCLCRSGGAGPADPGAGQAECVDHIRAQIPPGETTTTIRGVPVSFFFLPAGDTLDSASFSHFFPQFCVDFVFFPGTCPECISSEAPLTSETSKNIIHLLTISMIRARWRPSRSPR